MRLDGRTALVTGASGGIGSAVVDALVSAGIGRVIACDLNQAGLAALQEIAPDKIVTRALDVTDEAAVAAAAAAHPDVDILINCHGIVVHQSVLEADSIDGFVREMDVNYWGQVRMCRAFAPILNRGSGKALVNFLSPLAYVTFPFLAPYCATKAACRVLTEAMRSELASNGTLVMAVLPGTIDTPMMSNLSVPKGPPSVVADAVITGLRENTQEVWAGEGAEDMRVMLKSDPEALFAGAASQLRLKDINAAGEVVSS